MNLFFRLISLLFLLQVLFISNLTAKNPKSDIQKVLDLQKKEWNNGNLQGYMQGYWNSDSLLFIGKRGPKYGWQNTLESYQKAYPSKADMGQLEFGMIKFELLNANNALYVGTWKLVKEKETVQGFFTLVFRKINGAWVIISDHSS